MVYGFLDLYSLYFSTVVMDSSTEKRLHIFDFSHFETQSTNFSRVSLSEYKQRILSFSEKCSLLLQDAEVDEEPSKQNDSLSLGCFSFILLEYLKKDNFTPFWTNIYTHVLAKSKGLFAKTPDNRLSV